MGPQELQRSVGCGLYNFALRQCCYSIVIFTPFSLSLEIFRNKKMMKNNLFIKESFPTSLTQNTVSIDSTEPNVFAFFHFGNFLPQIVVL